MDSEQAGWRWCSSCQGLFFAGNATQGSCAAGGGHNSSSSGAYVVDLNQSDVAGQEDWRWCRKCQGLFFAGGDSGGTCPADRAEHDASESGNYILHGSTFGGVNRQSGWRWCRKCSGLFFGGGTSSGRCPAGSAHDGSASGDYVLGMEAQPSAIDTDPVMAAIRLHAGALLRAYVPSDTGDAKFSHIAKDYTGGGTTCGFLCHWLMWRLGGNDAKIINRSEPGFRYVDGQNVARIFNLGREPFIKVIGSSAMQNGLEPELGDIVFIKQHPNGPQNTEHVFVFLDKQIRNGRTIWSTAESGQKNSANQECARLKERELKLGSQRDAKVTGNVPERTVFGWLSLAKLSYNATPPIPPIVIDPLLVRLQ